MVNALYNQVVSQYWVNHWQIDLPDCLFGSAFSIFHKTLCQNGRTSVEFIRVTPELFICSC
jgi:hypothetical protein